MTNHHVTTYATLQFSSSRKLYLKYELKILFKMVKILIFEK